MSIEEGGTCVRYAVPSDPLHAPIAQIWRRYGADMARIWRRYGAEGSEGALVAPSPLPFIAPCTW